MYTCKECGVHRSTPCPVHGLPSRSDNKTSFIEKVIAFFLVLPFCIIAGFVLLGWLTILLDFPLDWSTVIMFAVLPAILTAFKMAIIDL